MVLRKFSKWDMGHKWGQIMLLVHGTLSQGYASGGSVCIKITKKVNQMILWCNILIWPIIDLKKSYRDFLKSKCKKYHFVYISKKLFTQLQCEIVDRF